MIQTMLLCFHINTKDFCIVELSTHGGVTETSENILINTQQKILLCTEILVISFFFYNYRATMPLNRVISQILCASGLIGKACRHSTLLGLKNNAPHLSCCLQSHSFFMLFFSLSCFLSGGDAGEEVWRLLPEQASGSHNSDSIPAVSHEQELSTAAQFRLRKPNDSPDHPVKHAFAVLV